MTAPNVFAWMAGQVPAAAPSPKKRQSNAGRAFTLSRETYQAIADMLAQGMAQGAIARRLGIQFYHVNNLKRRLAAGKGLPDSGARATDEHADQLADLVASGMTVKAAAEKLGISKSAGYGIIRYKLRTPAADLRRKRPPQ